MQKDKIIKKAFTMAEVLIVIGIIGILSTITIPILSSHANNKQLVSQTIKAMNTLSNAFKQADVVEGLTRKTYEDSADFVRVLYSYLKVLNQDEFGYVLMDGSRIKFLHDTYSSTCDNSLYEDGLPSAFKNVCMQVEVDVNGKKAPNEPGKDVYKFFITKFGVFASGKPDYCENGYDCGAYVLANHKLWDGGIEEVANNPNAPDEPEPQPEPQNVSRAVWVCEEGRVYYECDDVIVNTGSRHAGIYTSLDTLNEDIENGVYYNTNLSRESAIVLGCTTDNVVDCLNNKEYSFFGKLQFDRKGHTYGQLYRMHSFKIGNESANNKTYSDAQTICPEGWSLPTTSILLNYKLGESSWTTDAGENVYAQYDWHIESDTYGTVVLTEKSPSDTGEFFCVKN